VASVAIAQEVLEAVQRLIDALPLRIAYIDSGGICRFANRLHCELAGSPREAIVGAPWALGSGAQGMHLLDDALAGRAQTFEVQEWVGRERRTFEHRLVPEPDDSGATRGVIAIAFDVTERAAAQRALQRQGATLSSITESVPDSIMAVDSESRLRFANGAFERWRGIPRDQMLGRPLAEVLGDHEYLRIHPWAQRALAGETVSFDRQEHRGGTSAHVEHTYVPLRLEDGSVDGFVGVAQDVTVQRREQGRLMQLAHRDPLTGLLNRAGFDLRLQELMRLDDGTDVALLYVDLDHFKPVNDRHGHPVGDKLLQLVAQRFQHLVRPTDAVARLGGDEFAVLLGGMRDPAHAVAVAEKILAAAHAAFEVGALTLNIGASVGVAFGRGDANALATRADAALYEAKRAGRGVARVAPGVGLQARERGTRNQAG
jgi:diguanylate cyclase (GGDEF)-like protein/PAS domain S-box-containing protein